MSYLSLILGVIQIVQTLIKWGSDNRMFNEGAKDQIAKNLLEVTKQVSDAKKVEEWLVRQPDVNIESLLQSYYTRDEPSSS